MASLARFFVDLPLQADLTFDLPAEAARHVQVLRLQPGDALTLFNGTGGEWQARVTQMGRRDVAVALDRFEAVARELTAPVCLAVGMPANERFEWLIEKATELGAQAIQPLLCERSVVRLDGERAERKRAHWQGVARAAAEQSGRTRVPDIALPAKLGAFLQRAALEAESTRWMLSLADGAQPLAVRHRESSRRMTWLLSGPEGGLSPTEEAAALAAGFEALSLGARVLRSETAPLAALAGLAALG